MGATASQGMSAPRAAAFAAPPQARAPARSLEAAAGSASPRGPLAALPASAARDAASGRFSGALGGLLAGLAARAATEGQRLSCARRAKKSKISDDPDVVARREEKRRQRQQHEGSSGDGGFKGFGNPEDDPGSEAAWEEDFAYNPNMNSRKFGTGYLQADYRTEKTPAADRRWLNSGSKGEELEAEIFNARPGAVDENFLEKEQREDDRIRREMAAAAYDDETDAAGLVEKFFKPVTEIDEVEQMRILKKEMRKTGIFQAPEREPFVYKGRRSWQKDQYEMFETESDHLEWDIDPSKRGRDMYKGFVTAQDRYREHKREFKELMTLFHRPVFDWKELRERQELAPKLTPELPAIGLQVVRLSKFLSHCGVCSRRKAAELVLEGRVTLNGEIVKEVAVMVDPQTDIVTVDGQQKTLTTLGELIWIMVYKPKGVLTTVDDPQGRRTIMDLVPFARKQRLVPVGRLDRNASGLVIMTNDYEWCNILTHPRHEHKKQYLVQVYNGTPERAKMMALIKGMELPDEKYRLNPVKDLEVVSTSRGVCTLRFCLTQGIYRQVRRMFEYLGHPVKSIKREKIGAVKLDRELKWGEWRQLRTKEMRRLKGSTLQKEPETPIHIFEEQVQEAESGLQKARRLTHVENEDEKRRDLEMAKKKLEKYRHLEEMRALREGKPLPKRLDDIRKDDKASSLEELLGDGPDLKPRRGTLQREREDKADVVTAEEELRAAQARLRPNAPKVGDNRQDVWDRDTDVPQASSPSSGGKRGKGRKGGDEDDRFEAASVTDIRRLQAAFLDEEGMEGDMSNYDFAFEPLSAGQSGGGGGDWENAWVDQMDGAAGMAQAPRASTDDDFDERWAQHMGDIQETGSPREKRGPKSKDRNGKEKKNRRQGKKKANFSKLKSLAAALKA